MEEKPHPHFTCDGNSVLLLLASSVSWKPSRLCPFLGPLAKESQFFRGFRWSSRRVQNLRPSESLQRFALKLHKRLLFRLDFVFLTARTWCKLTKTTSSSASLSDSVFQQAVRVSKCSTPNFDPGVGAAAALLLSPVAWPKSPSSSCPAF